MNIEQIIQQLKEYEGPELKIMEVCGTHTASIFKSGIRSLISPKLRLYPGQVVQCALLQLLILIGVSIMP